MIATLQSPNHLESRCYPNQMSPASIRRESASAIDDFFEDFLPSTVGTANSVNANQGLMLRNPTAPFTSYPRSLSARQVPQVPTPDCQNSDQQDNSNTFIDELFGPCKDDIPPKRMAYSDKGAGIDVKPKFPASELPTSLEKMSENFWDLEDLSAIEIPDGVKCTNTDSERTSTGGTGSSVISTTSSDIPSTTERQIRIQMLPNGMQIKTEAEMVPVMNCNFQSTDVLSNNEVQSSVKMKPCLPTYSALCITSNKTTSGIVASQNGMQNAPIRPNFLSLSSSSLSIVSSSAPLSSMTSVKVFPAISNTFTVVPSQVQTGVPVVLQSAVLPPTPPDSQPNSPDLPQQQHQQQQQQQLNVRQTPPPPYPEVPILPAPALDLVGMGLVTATGKPRETHPGCTTIKYNRKNNPDLEKRRIHYCGFPGTQVLDCFFC